MSAGESLLPRPLLHPHRRGTGERVAALRESCRRLRRRRDDLDPTAIAVADLAEALCAAAAAPPWQRDEACDRVVLAWQMIDMLAPAPAGRRLTARLADAADLRRVARTTPAVTAALRAADAR